ncbi:hypothetical protein D3C80_1379310 [compost metagenome]
MAGKPVFHLDGEMVGIALEFGRQYLGTKDDNVRVVFLERSVEGEGQGTGKSVEDEVLVGKHRLDTVHLPAKFKLALRNAIGEGGENSVSHAVLRLQFLKRRIAVDKVFFIAIGKSWPPAQKGRALISDLGAEAVSGNGQAGNPRACCGSGHREIVLHASVCGRRADCAADSPDHLRCGDISQWP